MVYKDTYVDVEGALKTYLINNSDLQGLTTSGVGIFFGVPDKAAYPLITIEAAGGSAGRISPTDSPRITFSVWSTNKPEASKVMRRLRSILFNIDNVKLDAYTYCYTIDGGNAIWLPDNTDEKNKLARYVVDTTVTVRAV